MISNLDFSSSLPPCSSSQHYAEIDHGSTPSSEKSGYPILPSSPLSDTCAKIEKSIIDWNNRNFLLVRHFNAKDEPIGNDEIYNLATAQLGFVGPTINGAPEGKGIMYFLNGSTYRGDFLNGKCDGQGEITFLCGDKYKGEFKRGLRQGQGVHVWSTGEKYEGEFLFEKPHGEGKYVWKEGVEYVGEFQCGKPHGKGSQRYKNKEKYEGEFLNGNPHGKGVRTWADGEKYEGEFQDGNSNGKGVFSYKDGSQYEGEFQNNKCHGQGRMSYTNGSVFEGSFKYGITDVGHYLTFMGTKIIGGRAVNYSDIRKGWVKFGQGKLIPLTKTNTPQVFAKIYKEERLFFNAKCKLAQERDCPIENISNKEVATYLKGKSNLEQNQIAMKIGNDLIQEFSKSTPKKKKLARSRKFGGSPTITQSSLILKPSSPAYKKENLTSSSSNSTTHTEDLTLPSLECSSSTAASNTHLQGFDAILNEIQTISLFYKPLQRVKRWEEKNPTIIRNFTDKDRSGDEIKRYQEYSDMEISKFRQRHYLPKLECVLSSTQFKKLYTGRTLNGYMLSADMTYADGKVEGGQIGFGIDGNKIYHCYFESSMNFDGTNNTEFGDFSKKELDSAGDDGWVCDRPTFTISSDGILTVKFSGERHTIRVYPILSPN